MNYNNLQGHQSKHRALFPIQYPKIWELYKKYQTSFWNADNIDPVLDQKDWNRMNEDERFFIHHALAANLVLNEVAEGALHADLLAEMPIPEARCFISFQMMMSHVHAEAYHLALDAFMPENNAKQSLLQAMEGALLLNKKAVWAKHHLMMGNLAHKLITLAVMDTIFFAGSSSSFYWMKKRGLVPAMSMLNELVSNDKNLNSDFIAQLYALMDEKMDKEALISMLKEAISLEMEFVSTVMQVDSIGLSTNVMEQYIMSVADRLALALGQKKIFNVGSPFDFLVPSSLQGKANFFEKRVIQYQKTGESIPSKLKSFKMDEDF